MGIFVLKLLSTEQHTATQAKVPTKRKTQVWAVYRGESEKTMVKLIFCLIDKRVLKKGIWQQSHKESVYFTPALCVFHYSFFIALIQVCL
jgi:hypothetical protein